MIKKFYTKVSAGLQGDYLSPHRTPYLVKFCTTNSWAIHFCTIYIRKDLQPYRGVDPFPIHAEGKSLGFRIHILVILTPRFFNNDAELSTVCYKSFAIYNI